MYLESCNAKELKALFTVLSKGLVNGENIESMWIRTNLIGTLCMMLKNKHAVSLLQTFSAKEQFANDVKTLSRFVLHLLYNNADDFCEDEVDDDASKTCFQMLMSPEARLKRPGCPKLL